ncbi:hypothetical protein BJ322DRAFT_1025513 [Thelephora terrestris]|uniref:Zn(2)-C6 fungal-type domain-containing protein n=1 Tax=Thelephora terrestris TaxID=56493 RepID=A0A9P6H2P9_9AGAM|nr:hypothetical protein BJ322DRAFT_1025513 [Thelephora terrestris]
MRSALVSDLGRKDHKLLTVRNPCELCLKAGTACQVPRSAPENACTSCRSKRKGCSIKGVKAPRKFITRQEKLKEGLDAVSAEMGEMLALIERLEEESQQSATGNGNEGQKSCESEGEGVEETAGDADEASSIGNLDGEINNMFGDGGSFDDMFGDGQSFDDMFGDGQSFDDVDANDFGGLDDVDDFDGADNFDGVDDLGDVGGSVA